MNNFAFIVFLLALSWLAPLSISSTEGTFFSIDLEVSSQSEKERISTARTALLRLLTKTTGIKSIPRSEEILAAVDKPEAFYSGFSYKKNDETQGFTITYDFDENLVLGLIKRSNLPFWWSNRPNVIVWLGLDDGVKKILSSSDSHFLKKSLQERAVSRGISVQLPIMDLPDRRLVSYKEVKSGIAYNIDTASDRYAGNVSLVGTAKVSESSLDEPYFDGSWEFWFGNEHFEVDFKQVTAREGAQIGVDLVADVFAAKFAIYSGADKTFDWVISGVNDLSKYADLKNYFENLEIIDGFLVRGLARDQIKLRISSRASESKLVELLVREKVIFLEPFHRGPNALFQWKKG